jgi:hypothetical protein
MGDDVETRRGLDSATWRSAGEPHRRREFASCRAGTAPSFIAVLNCFDALLVFRSSARARGHERRVVMRGGDFRAGRP